jgi:hypothetical protein
LLKYNYIHQYNPIYEDILQVASSEVEIILCKKWSDKIQYKRFLNITRAKRLLVIYLRRRRCKIPMIYAGGIRLLV